MRQRHKCAPCALCFTLQATHVYSPASVCFQSHAPIFADIRAVACLTVVKLIAHVIGEAGQRDPVGCQQYISRLKLVGQGGGLLREESLHPDRAGGAAAGEAEAETATALLQRHSERAL